MSREDLGPSLQDVENLRCNSNNATNALLDHAHAHAVKRNDTCLLRLSLLSAKRLVRHHQWYKYPTQNLLTDPSTGHNRKYQLSI